MKGQIPGRRNRHTLTPTNRLATKEYLLLGGRHEKRRTNRQLYFLHTGMSIKQCMFLFSN